MSEFDEAIAAAVASGITDPHDVADHVIEARGMPWVKRVLAGMARQVIADETRAMYHRARNRADDRKYHQDEVGPCWFAPGMGWKPEAELTPSDCMMCAAYFHEQEAAARGRAEWFEALAADLRSAGAATVADLRSLGVAA